MFLEPEEIRRLTGKARRRSQIAWLVDNGYPFEVSGDGWPLVSRAYMLVRLGAEGQSVKPEKSWEPDWNAAAQAK